MATYPCSNCGAIADSATGCPSCGNSLLDEISLLNRTITSMQVRNRNMVEDRTALLMRLQGAITIRTMLQRAAGVERGTTQPTSRLRRMTGRARPMEVPIKRAAPPRRGRATRHGQDPTAQPTAGRPPAGVAWSTPTGAAGTARTPGTAGAAGTPGTAGGAAGARTRTRSEVPPQPPEPDEQSRPTAGTVYEPGEPPSRWSRLGRWGRADRIPRSRPAGPPPPPPEPRHPHHPPEATRRSMQNLVLGLGALVMAIVVGLTSPLYGALNVVPRLLLLLVATVVAMLVPLWFARRQLITTAEWLTPIGLLLVLLDAREVWMLALRHSGLRPSLYAALVCVFTAGVSWWLTRFSVLAVPKFAAIVLLQPVLLLSVYPWLRDAAGWAAVLTATAAVDLVIGWRTHRSPGHGRYLRAALRWLQRVVNLAALVFGGIALAQAHQLEPAVRAGAPLVAAAVVALAAGLLFGQWPLPDISTGIATVTLVVAFGRMAALALPGWGVLATAVVIGAVALGARQLPDFARRGAQLAGSVLAGLAAVLVIVRGAVALAGPVRAAWPPWNAALDAYPAVVARDSGPGTGQLIAATVLLTATAAALVHRAWRRDTLVAGVVLTTVLVPGAWHLPWPAAIASVGAVALALGAFGLTAPSRRESWTGIIAALVTGLYAASLAAARPAAMSVLLLAFAIGGAAIGAAGLLGSQPPEQPALAATAAAPVDPGATRTRLGGAWSSAVGAAWRWLGGGPPDGLDLRTSDAGWGAAALALPGSVVAATAALAPAGHTSAVAVLAAGFVTLAGTLSATAVSQVARRRSSPLIVGGATIAAVAVAVATLRTNAAAAADIAVALMLLTSAVLLCIAPLIGAGVPAVNGRGGRVVAGRRLFGLDSEEVAAAAVTAASIAAVARVASLIIPGYGLVTLAFLVFLVAVGARTMPAHWRRGPVAGGVLVGAAVVAGAGYAAVDAAFAVLRINQPLWHVQTDGWAHRLAAATTSTAHGIQTPVALLLIAAAAATVLRRFRTAAVIVACGLTALVLPATLGTGAWSPTLFSGAVATLAGLLAARMVDQPPSLICAAVATLLFADTIATSLVAPATTAGTLAASAAVLGAVAGTAATELLRSEDGPQAIPHLVFFGGGALAGGVQACAGAAASFAAAVHRPPDTVLTAAMAGIGVALALVGTAARRLAPLLVHATAAISLGGLVIALTDIRRLSVAGMYASVAALFAILAELLRAAVADESLRRGVRMPGAVPRRTASLLAAGPAALLALAGVLPTLLAALVGPFQTLDSVWRLPAPVSSLDVLGPMRALVGSPVGLLAAILLTLTAAIGAVGFPGSREAIVARLVAVVTPGVAVTLLIAPYLLRAGWPAGPTFALTVASISGLTLALTHQPAEGGEGAPALRAARRFVGVICMVSGAAAAAGSLATPGMTFFALAVGTGSGLVAALRGVSQTGRVTGWVVTSTSVQLLAMTICLWAHVKPYDAAFAVGAVAALLLLVAALLPALRLPERLNETLTIEVSSYAGAVLGLVLASRSIPHLAVFLAAWGAVLGMVAARQPSRLYRSLLMWTAAAHELVAWCLLMAYQRVGVPEAYTLGIAAVALVTGWLELRWHPQLTSWVTYGVALTAALGPSLAITIATGETPLRRILLLVGAAATTVFGAVRRQQAPVFIGGVALLGATINEIARYSTSALILALMAIIAAVLIGVGANFEKRRRNLRNVWTRVSRMQ